MATLPLELHHVLEDEYVSMYGPLDRSATDYTDAQIVDETWACTLLRECGIPQEGGSVSGTLTALVNAKTSLIHLRASRALTDPGRTLLEQQAESTDPEVRRRLIDEALRGAVTAYSDLRLEKLYSSLHKRAKEGKPRTALCISGGGVRTATFGLGIIQGLASANLLNKFHYLSTVSGGGYIGSWLSSWVRRHRDGVTGVQRDLQRADTAVGESQRAIDAAVVPAGVPLEPRQLPGRKVFPEPTPLRHLREYSSYLSPQLSATSGDTWTMISLYLRNLLLNLLVLVPLLALALAFPRVFSFVLEWSKENVLPPSAWGWIAAGLVTYAFVYTGLKRPVEHGRKAKLTATSDGGFIANCVLPLLGAGLAVSVFYARTKQNAGLLAADSTKQAAILALAGMTLIPWLLYSVRFYRSTSAQRRAGFAEGRRHSISKQLAELFAVLVAVATTAGLLYLLAEKVFDQPTLAIPITATLPPIDRATAAATPQAQLFVVLIVPLLLLVFFIQGSIFVGLSGRHNDDSDREWWGRGGAWLLMFSVGLAIFSGVAVFGPMVFYYAPILAASTGGIAGAAAAALGFSDKTSAKKTKPASTGEKTSTISSALMVPLFVAALLAAISLGTTWLAQLNHDPDIVRPATWAQKALMEAKISTTEPTSLGNQTLTSTAPRVSIPAVRSLAHLQTIQKTSGKQVLILVGLAAFALFLSTFIGVNRFSLHAFYRSRMIRGYLGASRYDRDPDRFTGFDEHDNLQMWELRPEVLWSSDILSPDELVHAMQETANVVPNRLWNALDSKTRDALKKKVDGVSVEGLVQNLNEFVMNRDLPAILNVEPPTWVRLDDTRMPYPRAIVNRATLDEQFAAWIDCMVPPADVTDAPRPPERKLGRAPLQVCNTTLNLTSGKNLAWQQRKAAAFSISPYHTGSFILGYRSSREYGGSDGISLGTAATISGAAASPNMGYNSSPPLAFLLTFFNLRLGAWLGNPGPRGDQVYTMQAPRSSLVPMLAELTGSSDANHKWVNLSDGGHFENLGLYEMVIRRCHEIVISDGGHDPQCTFEDLGNAIRKIRIDFGIPIDIESVKAMHPRSADGKPVEGSYVLTATIGYDAVDKDAQPGRLMYIKPGLYDNKYLPVDVYEYAMTSPTFPHESTADQFYTESQFESYRALARHAIDIIAGNERIPDGRGVYIPIARIFDDLTTFPEGTPLPPEDRPHPPPPC